MMNLFSASGQEQVTIDKETLSKYVKICEKCEADLKDYKGIVAELKVENEAKGVRLIELNQTVEDLNLAILKVKSAYDDLRSKSKKNKFWSWLKGVATGTVIGAVIMVIAIL